jgi:hypothetical protein
MRKVIGILVGALLLAGCSGAPEASGSERVVYLEQMRAQGLSDEWAERSAKDACATLTERAKVDDLLATVQPAQAGLLRIFAEHGVPGYCPERADAWSGITR